jgi:hypothetical protein
MPQLRKNTGIRQQNCFSAANLQKKPAVICLRPYLYQKDTNRSLKNNNISASSVSGVLSGIFLLVRKFNQVV